MLAGDLAQICAQVIMDDICGDTFTIGIKNSTPVCFEINFFCRLHIALVNIKIMLPDLNVKQSDLDSDPEQQQARNNKINTAKMNVRNRFAAQITAPLRVLVPFPVPRGVVQIS